MEVLRQDWAASSLIGNRPEMKKPAAGRASQSGASMHQWAGLIQSLDARQLRPACGPLSTRIS